MSANAFEEFKACWALAEDMIAKATKEQVAEVARILALQAAAYTRKFGDLPLEDDYEYLRATERDMQRAIAGDDGGRMVGLLRDGAVALVGVLAVVREGIGREADPRCSNLDAWAPREISPDSTLGPLSAQKGTVGRRTRRRRGGRHFR